MNMRSSSLLNRRRLILRLGVSALAVILIWYFSIGDLPFPDHAVSGTIGRKSTQKAIESAQEYLSDFMYQEAAWEYLRAADNTTANRVLDTLRQILQSQPISIKSLGKSIHVSKPYIITFRNDVRAIFKVENSDSLGPVKREEAVYKLDQFLGFNFTPMTITRAVHFPDGTIRRGSAMYFIRNCESAMDAGLEKNDKLKLFDAIIGNSDRHRNNWLIRDSGEIVAIDHNRAFRHDVTGFARTYWYQEIDNLEAPSKLGSVYENFKNYPRHKFEEVLENLIQPDRLKVFLATRKEIIERIESKKRKP